MRIPSRCIPPVVLAILSVTGNASASGSDKMKAPMSLAEARVGQGMALGGGAGESNWRMSPFNVSLLGSLAIQTEPWISVYGGLVFEGNQRAALGGTLGFRINPAAGPNRISLATTIMAIPNTAYGVTAGIGRCRVSTGSLGVCADLETTVFALGSDLPEGRVATQVQIVLGVAFDLL